MPGGIKTDRKQKVVPQSFEAYFDALLQSPQFLVSARRNELLRYLVKRSLSGQGQTLSEYAIALEVFRKPESFDQRIDSTVRSEISRLRKFLSIYYEGPGAADRWRISFPLRSYIPEISQVEPVPSKPDDSNVDGRFPKRTALLSAAGGIVLIALIASALIWEHRHWNPPVRSTNQNGMSAAHRSHVLSPAAQALYLKGQFYWEHRTNGSLHEAVDAYTQAIVADSDYAEAYAGLAASYDLMPEYSAMPQQEAFSRAIAAANKAISLDPSISIAHRALGFGLFWSQTDIPRSFSEFEEAVRLAPNDAEAHHWFATALNSVRRFAEARKQIDIAQQLDPSSRSILADQAWIRYSAGDTQAIAKLRELEIGEPDFKSPPDFLARIDLAQGNYAGYLEQIRRLAAISNVPADRRFAEAAQKGWNTGGSTGMLRTIKAVQEESYATNQSDGYDLARTCALLGEKQPAVKYLQAAFASKDIFVLDALDPNWAPALNGYPPFESFRAQIRSRFGIE